MKKEILLYLMLLPLTVPAVAGDGDVKWKKDIINASRTGVTVPMADIPAALGTVRCRTYYAPNGRVYKGGSVHKVVSLLTEAQPAMAKVKEVIAFSPEAMVKEYPESALTNFFIDNLMIAVEEASGKKVDVGIGNFGGVRVDMPQGNVLYDDIRSMFPFRNDIVYVALKGSELRAIFEDMAEKKFQILGGVKIVAADHKLVSVEIGGEPLDDDRVYGVASISFLLNGGDGLFVANNAVEVDMLDIDIFTAMMDRVAKYTEAGRPLTGAKDGRVTIITE